MRFIATSLFLVHPMALAWAAGAQQRPDTAMKPPAARLEVPVVSDTSWRLFGEQHIPRAVGASIGVIDSAMLVASSAHTLSELLAGRVPGVSVLRSSGVLGTGSRVRFRGAGGLIVPREPILIVDGLRADASQRSLGVGIGGQQPSRLDDIELDDVARIELLRGPAASALYGTDAAGGVIRVTTHAPRRGRRSWSVSAETGASRDATDYPANYSTGSGIAGEATCTRARSVLSACTPGPLLTWNPLDQASPFRTGSLARVAANVTGGTDRFGYLASGGAHDERGVLAPNEARRYSARVNLDADPARSLRVALRTSYVGGRTSFPFSGATYGGTLTAGLTGNAVDDPVDRGYQNPDPESVRDAATIQHIARLAESLTAAWSPARWLAVRALAGHEGVRRDDDRSTSFATGALGDLTRVEGSTGRDDRVTLTATSAAAYSIAKSIGGQTLVGIERLSRSARRADSVATVQNGAPVSLEIIQTRARSTVTGVSAAQRFAWRDRRFLGLGVRRDKTDASRLEPTTYFSADGAWVLSEEPFFPQNRVSSALRLRGAFGRSADQRTYLSATSAGFPFTGDPAPELDLPGETISEIEAGIDAFLFDRFWLEATWYRQHSTNALTPVCCINFPPLPVGAWRTTGIDAALSAALVTTLDVDWHARLTVSTLSNRVERLGEGSGRRNIGPTFLPLVRNRLVPGYPVAGIWGYPLRIRDANGDGVIVPGEIDVSADSVYLGSPTPTREVGLSTTVALRRATLSVLLDYRGGLRQVNVTEDFRCELETCRALYDPQASLGDQARALSVGRSGAGFVEDASFVRLREVALTWTLLPGWSYRHGVGRLAFTVAGRNLFTSTRYSGLDPEVNGLGQSGFGTADFLVPPLPRTFIAGLEVRR